MNRTVNIGIIQVQPQIGEVEINVSKAMQLIAEAAGKQAEIVCLPELFATGYNGDILKERSIELGIRYYNYVADKISQTAKKHRLYIIAPFSEKRDLGGVVYNSAILFDDNGKIVGSYAKTHLWDKEKLYFKEGSDYPVFATKYGKIGIAIGYDLIFPEVCRNLCLNGADIIFVPSAWGFEDNEIMWEEVWDRSLHQRALENVLFTIGVNRVGKEGNMYFRGMSKIYNPKGELAAELSRCEEQVKVMEIDVADVEKARIENPFLRDRKPNLYSLVLKA